MLVSCPGNSDHKVNWLPTPVNGLVIADEGDALIAGNLTSKGVWRVLVSKLWGFAWYGAGKWGWVSLLGL